MSIYNFTVLKSKPVIASIPQVTPEGTILSLETPIYRVKWHGSDGSIDNMYRYDNKPPGMNSSHWSYFDYLQDRAGWRWNGTNPQFIMETHDCDSGKLDWSSAPDGYRVFQYSGVAFQEDGGFQRYVGNVVKVKRGQYEFVPRYRFFPKVLEGNVRRTYMGRNPEVTTLKEVQA